MLWFNLILTTAALCETQLVPRFQIEFRLYKIEQQGSYWVIEMSMVMQSEAALSDLGWKTLKERRLIMKARFMYKITHSQALVALTEIFENSQQIYNLRNNEFKLYLPKPNTEYLKKSIGF